VGSSIKVRKWKVADSEPGTWDIDITDSNYSSGFFQFSMIRTSGAAGTLAIDDLSIEDLTVSQVTKTHTADAVRVARLSSTHTADGLVGGIQFAYPISDISFTNWETAPTPGGSLYAQLDEGVRSDTDYIYYDG
jgi:hypothetical protein